METIKFKDLSNSLKTLIVIGWGIVVLNGIAFLFGFIAGFTGG